MQGKAATTVEDKIWKKILRYQRGKIRTDSRRFRNLERKRANTKNSKMSHNYKKHLETVTETRINRN